MGLLKEIGMLESKPTDIYEFYQKNGEQQKKALQLIKKDISDLWEN